MQTELGIKLVMETDSGGSSPSVAVHLPEDPAKTTTLVAIKASKSSLMTKVDTLALECGLILWSFYHCYMLHLRCGGHKPIKHPDLG